MKFVIRFLSLVCVFLSPQLFGQLLLQENFLTPVTDVTTLLNWGTVTGVGTSVAPPYIVVNSGTALQYPGYIESGVGNAAYLVGTGQDAQVSFPATGSTGSYYLTFMVKVDSASTTGDYFWMVRNSSNHNRWRGWVKRSAAGEDSCYFGVSKGSTVPTYSTRKVKMSNTVHLIVAKYDFNTAAGANDALLALWVDPAASTFGKAEPTSLADVPPTQADNTTADFISPYMNRFALIQGVAGTSPTCWVGGVRFGNAWHVVLPPSPLYYNFSGTGDLSNVNNWGSNLDGSGTHPSDFSADNQLYLVRNATPATPKILNLSGMWVITGSSSKLIVGAGVDLTISAAGYLNGVVDVSSGGTFTVKASDNFYWPTFGNNAGTVYIDNAAVTLSGSQVLPSGAGPYILKSGDLNVGNNTLSVQGRLDCNSFKITGSGTFKVDSAGTLLIYSPLGITTTGNTGDIQTGTRTFHRYGNYTYAGKANQVTGNALPDTVNNLSLAMANGKLTTTLSKFVAATGNLSMSPGKFVLGNFNLMFSNPGSYSDSGYVITNGTGTLIRPIANTSVKTMPVGSATEYRRIALTFESTPSSSRNVNFQFIPDSANAGFPKGITSRYPGGYWKITSDSSTNPTFKLDITVPSGFDTTTAKPRILYRANATSAWDTVGTTWTFSNGVASQAGVSKFGQFALGSAKLVTGVEPAPVPGVFRLDQNYPNPFNPSTTIRYSLPKTLKVSLLVYNMLGQQVVQLIDAEQPAGTYDIAFDASPLASGVYFYRLVTPGKTLIRKMILMK